MSSFSVAAAVYNLRAPKSPLRIQHLTLQRSAGVKLDPSTLSIALRAVDERLLPDVTMVFEFLQRSGFECVIHANMKGADPQDALARAEQEFQKVVMSIELVTGKAVYLGGRFVSFTRSPSLPIFSFLPGRYPTEPANIARDQVASLEEIVTALDSKSSRRVETALLEYDIQLKSQDVRRQFIHAVVALEALFGDDATEALSYKVPLRAVQMVPSLSVHKVEAFKRLREAYSLRSKFVHGTWDESELRKATAIADWLRRTTAEAIREFLLRIKSAQLAKFPELDAELFLG